MPAQKEGHPGALKLVASRLAEILRPRKRVPFSKWLTENIMLVDGPHRGELWSPAEVPGLLEIAEVLDLEHPCNLVTVRKAQQTGISILGLAWALYLADEEPDNILYGLPGKESLEKMNTAKFQPMIDAWQGFTGKRVIEPTKSRSGEGSKLYQKKIVGGGLIFLANANTVMDLSASTCRYGIKDEFSKWSTLPNGADPDTLFLGRFTAYLRRRIYKIFEFSTPENDSGVEGGDDPAHCRIDRSFQSSDQRYLHIECPSCGFSQAMFGEGLQVNRENPDLSTYLCENCGHDITESERIVALKTARFVAHKDNGTHPGFHYDAFCSKMVSLGDIARASLASEGKSEEARKDYTNLYLALPYAIKGNAPDHVRLMERREDYPRRVIPAQGLIVVAGVDVQHNGLFVEVTAWAEDRQSWVVDALFLPGKTDNINAGAWEALDAYMDEPLIDVWGNERTIDASAVDAGDGNRKNQVLEWCRRRSRVYAIKGEDGRKVPPIGTPKKTTIKASGKVARIGSAMLWPVGTWDLKDLFYGYLHLIGRAGGQLVDPQGYCHFGSWLDEEYFKQITAEYFDAKLHNGRMTEGWFQIRRDNHYLDCRVYGMAMAEKMGLTSMRPEGWAALRAQYMPKDELDLLSADPEKSAAIQVSTLASSKTDSWAEKFSKR
ncbi:MAG: terminase gpA endonuclease subunit [Pseudomonadota bacterium]